MALTTFKDNSMKTTTLQNYSDLVKFGLNSLTGEACVYGHRTLFDVSKEGAELIRCYFGLPLDCPLLANWNAKVGDADALGSIMLSRAVVKDLMIFALLHVGDFDRVIVSPMGTTGYNLDDSVAKICDEYRERNPTTTELHYNVRKTSKAPNAGGRNVHNASGRVE
jgi:hypothetical protein